MRAEVPAWLRRLAARTVAGAVLVLAGLPAFAFELPTLMALLAAQRSGEASFTEQRWVRGLDAPLASSGRLSYEAPDRLVRRTIEPRPETMAIDGNRVTLTRSGRSRSFSLDAAPELVGLVEAMRATLTGNEAVLRRYFETRVDGNAAQWLMVLTPLEPRLAAQLRQIRIAGRQGQLERVEMDMADGDRSVMTVTPQRAAAPSPSLAPSLSPSLAPAAAPLPAASRP